MLYRNLIYTGLTRAKKLTVFVGTRRALSMAVSQQDTSQRQTALDGLVKRGRSRLATQERARNNKPEPEVISCTFLKSGLMLPDVQKNRRAMCANDPT